MKRILLSAASTSILATGLALTATAQAGDDAYVADTIIVTAPGPERSADELIGNATALEREDIVERLAGSLGDTLDSEPGVASTFFGQGASRPVLRGLGAERVQVLTNGIGVIDASAASPDHQVTTDGIDAEKIEILRGPAALAYGGQAIGGVVNVIDGLVVEELPEAPASVDLFGAWNSVNEGSELAGRAQFSAGPLVFSFSASQRDFDDYDIPGFAESDRLRALEEAEHEHEEDHDHEDDHDHDDEHDHEEDADTLENSFVETGTLAGGLSWVGESGFLGVAIRQQTSEYGLPGHAHGHEHGDEEHGEEEHGEEEHEEDEHGHEHGEEENAFIDLEQTRVDVRGGLELDAGPVTELIGTLAFVDYEHTEFEAPGEPGTSYESDGWEGRLEATTELGGYQGALGLQYIDKSLDAFGEEAFISPTDTEAIGVFLYQTREWDSGFGIEAGARAETAELSNISGISSDFDLFSGSFGLHQHLDNGWFVGTQLSYTERAPNESELFADGPHLATQQYEVGNPGIDKERGTNLEGTARWRGDGLSFGANLFVTEFSDFIYLTPGQTIEDGVLTDTADGLPVFQFVQEDASFIGGELYGEAEIDSGFLGADWALNASLDYVDGELDGGGNVPFLPPLTLNGGASAEWGAWEIGASLTLAGDQDDPGAGQLATDGYTVVNLRGEVDLSDFDIGADGTEAFIEARNLTDEEVRFATSSLKDLAPAPGRNIRIGVRLAY